MALVLRVKKKSAGEALRIADRLFDKAGCAWQKEDVHELRKRLKEIRALLRLLRGPLGQPRFAEWNGRLRDMARGLSGQRDAEAMLETWERLRQEKTLQALTTDSQATVSRRLRARIPVQPAAAEQGHGAVAEELDRVRRALRGASLSNRGFRLLGVGLSKTYSDGRKALRRLRRSRTDNELRHAWRKRVKDHWYQTRLLRDIWPQAMALRCQQLQRLSDLLGDDHDLALLEQLLSSQPRLFGGPRILRQIQQAVAERRRALLDQALPLGERLYAERAVALADRWRSYWKVARRADT